MPCLQSAPSTRSQPGQALHLWRSPQGSLSHPPAAPRRPFAASIAWHPPGCRACHRPRGRLRRAKATSAGALPRSESRPAFHKAHGQKGSPHATLVEQEPVKVLAKLLIQGMHPVHGTLELPHLARGVRRRRRTALAQPRMRPMSTKDGRPWSEISSYQASTSSNAIP